MPRRPFVGSETSAEQVKQIVGLSFFKGWPTENVLLWQTFQSAALAAHSYAQFELSRSWSLQALGKRFNAVQALRYMCTTDPRLKYIPELASDDILDWRLRQEHKMLRQQYRDANIRASIISRRRHVAQPSEAAGGVRERIERQSTAQSTTGFKLPYDPVRDSA